MEWLGSIRGAIEYMEGHLLTVEDADEVAGAVYMSPFYLQKGFKVMTGIPSGSISAAADFTWRDWM